MLQVYQSQSADREDLNLDQQPKRIPCKGHSAEGPCQGSATFGFMMADNAPCIEMCSEHAVAGMVSSPMRCQNPDCRSRSICGGLDVHGRFILMACSLHKKIGYRTGNFKCNLSTCSFPAYGEFTADGFEHSTLCEAHHQALAAEAGAAVVGARLQLNMTNAKQCIVEVAPSIDICDYTEKHYGYFSKRQWAILECGGAGNCFFLSVCVITRLYGHPIPYLFKSHAALRRQVAKHFEEHIDSIMIMGDSISTLLVARPQNYLKMQYSVGNYVEYECLCAFAHLVKAPVIVWSIHCSMPMTIFPDGRGLGETESLPDTIFKFWTNGSHYQALVPMASFTCTGKKPPAPVVKGWPFFINSRDVDVK